MRRSLLALAFAVAAPPLAAQSIHGRLLGADSVPVAGAIVALVDSTGAEAGRVLSSAIGSYSFHPSHPGTFTIRVFRIGYPAFTSPRQALAPDAVVDYSTLLPETPIVLHDIEVNAGGNSCASSDTLSTGTTATLLEEVRKAFGSVDLALRDHDLRFEVRSYVRRTDKNSVQLSADSALQTLVSWPVHSLPAAQLRDHGFVVPADSVDPLYVPYGQTQGKVWFGPDPTTLFAEPFLATHCYRVARDTRDSTRIGLTFAPVRGRRLPEIAGTLWLDRATLGLRALEYHYVNLPRYFADLRNGTGGTMTFVRLPAGIWVVARWDLRAPIEELYNNGPVGVAGYLDQGGRITRIRTTAGAVLF